MQRTARTITGLLIAVAIGAGCSSATNPQVPEGAMALEIREFPAAITPYLYTGIAERQRLAIDDAAEWRAFWNRVTSTTVPQPPVPEIDFASEIVIIAAMGTRPSGGYAIHIDDVSEADGRVFVKVREVSPGTNCIVTMALTAPVVAVRIPRRAGAVTFVEQTEVRNCQ